MTSPSGARLVRVFVRLKRLRRLVRAGAVRSQLSAARSSNFRGEAKYGVTRSHIHRLHVRSTEADVGHRVLRDRNLFDELASRGEDIDRRLVLQRFTRAPRLVHPSSDVHIAVHVDSHAIPTATWGKVVTHSRVRQRALRAEIKRPNPARQTLTAIDLDQVQRSIVE